MPGCRGSTRGGPHGGLDGRTPAEVEAADRHGPQPDAAREDQTNECSEYSRRFGVPHVRGFRPCGFGGSAWWAVRDLNPRPLACHEPRARSGAVADERFVPLKWTFAKVQFTSVQLDSPALLTRLLTREPLESVGISSHSAASTA